MSWPSGITDRNYRLFAERGELHVINSEMHLRGTDAFALLQEIMKRDPKLDPAHAFYLGYESEQSRDGSHARQELHARSSAPMGHADARRECWSCFAGG